MSFENGIFIPEPPVTGGDPSAAAATHTHRSSGLSGSQNSRRGGGGSSSNSNQPQRSYQNHQKPKGDYNHRHQQQKQQRGRGGGSSNSNRNNDSFFQQGQPDTTTPTAENAHNSLSSLMQLTLTGLNSASNFGDLNPDAPTFQPRNFNNPNIAGISSSSRNGGPRSRHHGDTQSFSSGAANGKDYGQHGRINKSFQEPPLSQKQHRDSPPQRFSNTESDIFSTAAATASSSQRSPRKIPNPRPSTQRNYQRGSGTSNDGDTISEGYQNQTHEDPLGSSYYQNIQNQRFPKNPQGSRATRDSRNQTDNASSRSSQPGPNYRQPSIRSNNSNWRSEPGPPDPKPNVMENWGETWEGEEVENIKYKNKNKYKEAAGGGAGYEENSEENNIREEKFFERFRTQLLEKKRQPDIRNQRETLSDQLSRNAYDCMICVEKVRRSQPIWSCQKCYNVFHLNCLRKWASSSADEVGWRCPGCQTYSEEIPSDYRCFCGSMKNPLGTRADVPHSCGQTCGRSGIGGIDCIHSCTIQCHPGPCPPCEALLTRNCCCGKTNAQVKCSSKAVMTCGSPCDKLLNCQNHTCTRPCHGGECDPCAVIIKLLCYCGTTPKEVLCTSDTASSKNYSCQKPCGKSLNCKRHSCDDLCHPSLCKPCKMSPEAVLSCPCGQTPITEVCLKKKLRNRVSCLDPIPTCGKSCKKILPCGEPGDRHTCQQECHLQPECPSCPLVTPVKCRCGNKKFDIPCIKFNSSDDVLCEKKCTKKRNCGRHKCNTKCCIDHDHICPIVCERPLRCANHNCSLLCHNGHCPPCRTVSFEELSCECGTTIIYPPVPCGTKPAMCHQPCPRTHDCDHPVLHTCHSEPTCPPCTVLTSKWCNGNHDLRKNVMCHIKQVSCGMPCNKLLPCGRHKCARFCHPGDCHTEREICKLACEARRKDCGHHCGAPCHEGPCPDIKCKLTTDVTCDCGRKKETMVCWKREKEYDRLICYLSAIELKRLAGRKPNEDGEVCPNDETEKDENGYLLSIKKKTPKTNILECDKECARVERNRKMMEALQLEDPDVTSTFGTPNYTDFLVSFAKKNPQFVEMVHQRLTSLVLKARKSKRKNETYGFESMNRDKRHFVHEYSDHFGCLSESFDEEPNRNVICTASKEKSYCPSVNLIDAVFRPNLESKRKNAYDDVEVFQTSKSQIMRPANGKIILPSRAGSGMVALSGPTTSAWQQPSGDFPPLN